MPQKDTLFAKPLQSIAGFRFDEEVVAVFSDMIQRSVPGYETIIHMTGVLAERFAQTHSHCYDLGCSLGGSSFTMREQLTGRDCKIIAIDNSQAMLDRLQALLQQHSQTTDIPVELRCEDIVDSAIENASVVVLNFTLQFIPLPQRQALLDKIFRGMRSGGILVLSEKIRFQDSHLDQLNIDLHHAFKRANGYSDLEISQKRSALENVLLPETLDTHQQRLQQAGFNNCDVWFQCFNFASLIALKA